MRARAGAEGEGKEEEDDGEEDEESNDSMEVEGVTLLSSATSMAKQGKSKSKHDVEG